MEVHYKLLWWKMKIILLYSGVHINKIYCCSKIKFFAILIHSTYFCKYISVTFYIPKIIFFLILLKILYLHAKLCVNLTKFHFKFKILLLYENISGNKNNINVTPILRPNYENLLIFRSKKRHPNNTPNLESYCTSLSGTKQFI